MTESPKTSEEIFNELSEDDRSTILQAVWVKSRDVVRKGFQALPKDKTQDDMDKQIQIIRWSVISGLNILTGKSIDYEKINLSTMEEIVDLHRILKQKDLDHYIAADRNQPLDKSHIANLVITRMENCIQQEIARAWL
jgi:hypothetical protein